MYLGGHLGLAVAEEHRDFVHDVVIIKLAEAGDSCIDGGLIGGNLGLTCLDGSLVLLQSFILCFQLGIRAPPAPAGSSGPIPLCLAFRLRWHRPASDHCP